VERAAIELAIENPALGQLRASQELLQRGIIVSSGGVRSIWLRHELETMKKRLKALQARSAQEGILLTEEQIVALTRREAKPKRCSRKKKPMERLKPIILAILERRTPTLSAQ
jgi:hypothetical protein